MTKPTKLEHLPKEEIRAPAKVFPLETLSGFIQLHVFHCVSFFSKFLICCMLQQSFCHSTLPQTTVPWGCAPRASPRSWRPPRAPLRASTAASPPPRTTLPTPSLVSAVLHRALAPACVPKCARVSLCTLLCPGGQGPARTCARAVPGASAAGANARRPLAAAQPHSLTRSAGSRSCT